MIRANYLGLEQSETDGKWFERNSCHEATIPGVSKQTLSPEQWQQMEIEDGWKKADAYEYDLYSSNPLYLREKRDGDIAAEQRRNRRRVQATLSSSTRPLTPEETDQREQEREKRRIRRATNLYYKYARERK